MLVTVVDQRNQTLWCEGGLDQHGGDYGLGGQRLEQDLPQPALVAIKDLVAVRCGYRLKMIHGFTSGPRLTFSPHSRSPQDLSCPCPAPAEA